MHKLTRVHITFDDSKHIMDLSVGKIIIDFYGYAVILASQLVCGELTLKTNWGIISSHISVRNLRIPIKLSVFQNSILFLFLIIKVNQNL